MFAYSQSNSFDSWSNPFAGKHYIDHFFHCFFIHLVWRSFKFFFFFSSWYWLHNVYLGWCAMRSARRRWRCQYMRVRVQSRFERCVFMFVLLLLLPLSIWYYLCTWFDEFCKVTNLFFAACLSCCLSVYLQTILIVAAIAVCSLTALKIVSQSKVTKYDYRMIMSML